MRCHNEMKGGRKRVREGEKERGGGINSCIEWFLLFLSQDEGGPNVKLQKLVFAPDDHAEVELDLTGVCVCVCVCVCVKPPFYH